MPRLRTLPPRVQQAASRLAPVPRPSRALGKSLYSYRWQQARLAFLAAHPLCECPDCDGGRKRVRASTVVDHRVPHRGDLTLFWDEANWVAMAKECHDAKTAAQDGGFGNPTRGAG